MKVRIAITGTQRADGEQDTVTQTVVGTLTRRGAVLQLRYTERDEDGVVTGVTVCSSPREVTVERHGAARSLLRLRPGEHCHSAYGTPYGVFDVTTHTHALHHALQEQGGTLMLSYTLWFGGQAMENTLHMDVQPLERNEQA